MCSSLPPTWVFLHGFLGNGQDWQPVVDALTAQGQAALALDLPGHQADNAQLNSVATLSFDWLCEWLAAQLAAAGLSAAAAVRLVGYSLGGRLALAAAVRRPAWLHSLVLESASPGVQQPAARQQRAALDAQRAEQLRQHGLPNFLRDWYAQPLFASLQTHPHLLAATLQRRQAQHAESLARVLQELSPGLQPSQWEHLSRVACPTLLLAGELDPLYCQMLKSAQAQFSRALFVPVAAAGHNIHLEQPVRYLDALRQFASHYP